ncbi:MAG TPA: hypothetical protein PK369_02300 [Thermoclostridium sp.]|nr:hypothetical protein [Clostridiaceae bacterium]HOQ75386.1 hypothetical protein [Thermoclostridium sp.]HPU44636.1 hypothetical protein [Thermoclostridium sp.]
MLGKLIKYELKATGRTFLPLYAALLVFAAVTKLTYLLSDSGDNIPAVISLILYIIILTGMFVMTFVVMIQRFYKNLLSDEGYLMFTLPVETWKHITSKLLVSVIWNIGSIAAAILSIVILSIDDIISGEMKTELSIDIAGSTTALALFELILACIAGMVFGILIIYASIAWGHLSKRHRIMASIGAFLALATFSQIMFFCFTVMPVAKALQERGDILYIGLDRSLTIYHWFMWILIAFLVILSALFFAITNYVLNRELNLE